MAFVHFQTGTRSKLLDKAPASVHVAYLLREPYGPAAAHVDYLIRQSEKTQTREDLVYSAARNLPAFAQGSPSAFFASGEIHGRVNAQLGQTRAMSLPRELTRDQQIALCHDYAESQFGTRYPYMFAIHAAQASDGRLNEHMHLIYSTKIFDGIERPADQFWKRHNPEHPERGGAQVERWFAKQPALYAQRQAWSDCCNRALETAGQDARVSPLRFAERGIARDRDPDLAAYHPTQSKQRGVVSKEWQQRLDGQAAREATRAVEHTQAAQAWEARKQQLGIAIDTPREQFLARVYEATRAYQPERRLTAAELAIEAPLVEQQRKIVQQMASVVVVEKARVRTGSERSAGAKQRIHKVWEQASALGLDRDARDLTRQWDTPLIGNRVSLIYHTPEHKNYGDVAPKNQVQFWTEQAAMDAGYRRAANDHYGRGTGVPMTREPGQRQGEASGDAVPRERHHDHHSSIEERVAAIREGVSHLLHTR